MHIPCEISLLIAHTYNVAHIRILNKPRHLDLDLDLTLKQLKSTYKYKGFTFLINEKNQSVSNIGEQI